MNWIAALIVLAAAAPEPCTYILETDTNVWDNAVTDLDQNGIKDILLLTNDETAFPLKKELCAFLSDENGAYPKTPSCRLDLDEQVGALFLAEVDGKPPVEVVAASGAGARVYQFDGTAFHPLKEVEYSSLYPAGSREPCFVKLGAKDLNDDGIDEWLTPTARGVQIRTLDRELALIPCDVVSEMRSGESLYITHRLPDIQTFPVEGQQALGLAFLSDEYADFAYGEDWSLRKRVRLPLTLKEKWDASASMKDINGDHFPDLVITQMRGTVRMYAETQVYLAKEPFVYAETPDAVFPCNGAVSSPVIMDVDGDKLLDLVFIRIPFGVGNIVNFFVRGKISARAEVYLFDGNGFRDRADYGTSMTMDAPEGRSRVAYTFGDFNGDGRQDAAYGSAGDVLAVYTGDPERFISSKPWKKFNMPSFGIAHACDLNNNPAEDIILIRPGSDKAKRVDVIVF